MKVKASSNMTAAAVEYFLYGVIILETAVAAFAYKAIAQIAQLSPGARTYLVLLYFGVLAWVFFQLNRLHRKRKQAALAVAANPDERPETPLAPHLEPTLASARLQAESIATPVPHGMVALAVENQPDAKPEVAPNTVAAAAAPSSVLPFGLTFTQIAIVLVVFLAALKVFSWALANLVKP